MNRRSIKYTLLLVFSLMINFTYIEAAVHNKNEITLAYGKCDINGDNKSEHIYLKYIEESDIYLVIKDSTNKKILLNKGMLQHELLEGQCILKFNDFNGDDVKDIMVIYKYNGSGGFSSCGIYGFKDNILTELKEYGEGNEDILNEKSILVNLKKYRGEYFACITNTMTKKTIKLKVRDNEVDEKSQKVDIYYHGIRYSIKDADGDGKNELAIYRTLKSGEWRTIGAIEAYYKYTEENKWVMIDYKIEDEVE